MTDKDKIELAELILNFVDKKSYLQNEVEKKYCKLCGNRQNANINLEPCKSCFYSHDRPNFVKK